MSKRRFRVSALAKADDDVEKIYLWLRKRSATGAASWYQAYLDAAVRLESSAESCPRCPEGLRFVLPVRELLFKTRRGKRYRLLFIIDGTDVFILRVRGPGQRVLRRKELGP